MNSVTPPPTRAAEPACYVYGVVSDSAPEPATAQGVGDPPAPVTLVRHRGVAALVSEVDPGASLGSPADLRAHANVLDTVAQQAPTLPFRFGGVVRDVQAVTDELLGPFGDTFAAALEDLGDRAQFAVRGEYRQGTVLQEILADRPDIAELNDQTRELSEEAGHYQRIQLGEMVSGEMEARRQQDTSVLLERLTPLTAAASANAVSADLAVDVAFLVESERRQEFEAAVEELARDWAGRIDVRLLGPLAPYDFVADLIDQAGGGPDQAGEGP